MTWDGGGKWDGGGVWDGSNAPPRPPPLLAVTEHCQICGSAVFCGGTQCPSPGLPLAPDGVPMIQEEYISVDIFNFITGLYIKQVA